MENEKKKKKLQKPTLIAIIIGAVVVVGLGGFFLFKGLSKSDSIVEKKDDEEVVVSPSPSPEPSIEPVKIVDLNSDTRPYAIMINCANEALPKVGLKNAYIVYEIMVEYGITRMMAYFKDINIDKVGSVRSLRNQFIGYAFENDAIIVHAGSSAEAEERLVKEGITHIDVDGQYGVRDKTLKRSWEHTLFTNSTLLSKAIKNGGIRSTTDVKPPIKYSASEVDLSKYKTQTAKKVSIKYSSYRTSIYEYNGDTKLYNRFMNKNKDVDLNTKEQATVKNIIIYGVHYTQYTNHNNPNYVRPENIGTGEGYYVTDGVALPITWEKKDEKSQTVYKVKETGEELVVNDGNTYVQIYPTNGGKLTIE